MCRRSVLDTLQIIENLVKFRLVVLRYASGQTDRQTDKYTETLMTIKLPPTKERVIILSLKSRFTKHKLYVYTL